MKQFRKRKLNNKGLSLVEILVTVVIIALISAPIVDSFISAIRVNAEARTIQNGTAVAQDTAELFKVFDVEKLVESYEKDGVIVSSADDVYTFYDIPMTGADGEEFLVNVELNPSSYTATGVETIDMNRLIVNNVSTPGFSGLYGSDSIMIYKQYISKEENLYDLFREQQHLNNISDTTLEKLKNPEEKEKIKKDTEITIDCRCSGGEYIYKVYVKVRYTHTGESATATAEDILEKTYKKGQIHTIYMLCPIFDRYTFDNIKGSSYASDKISIIYTFTGNANDEKDLYFYIAEQNMKNIEYTEYQQRLHPTNILVNNVPYTIYDNEKNKLKIYTNIGDNYTGFTNKYNLTYAPYSTGNSLYKMKVTVKLDDKVVTTFDTTK